MNYSLFIADAAAFEIAGMPTLFTFVFYSVNNFVFNFIKEVTPSSWLAQGLWICGFVFALLLGIIFVSLVFTERAKRYDEELRSAIAAIEEDGQAMEVFLREHYSVVNVEDVIAELQRLKSGMVKVILFFAQRGQ